MDQEAQGAACEALLRLALAATPQHLEPPITELRSTKSLEQAVTNQLASGRLPTAAATRLKLVLDLYVLAGRDAAVAQQVLQRVDEHATIPTIAKDHYSTIQNPAALPLKQGLFQQEPTQVILGLLQRGELADDVDVRVSAARILQTALDESHFDILRTSILQLATNPGQRLEGSTATDEFLCCLQRLCMVVEYPDDLAALLRSGFKSAAMIAAVSVDQLADIIASRGLIMGSPGRIHAQATLICSRNEHAWAQTNLAQQASVAPANNSWETEAGSAPPDRFDALLTTEAALRIPNSKDVTAHRKQAQPAATLHPQLPAAGAVLVDMDDVACEDCCSVLSPSAYFVDLLRLLKNSWIDDRGPKGESVLQKLDVRRPDLQRLQLSCANTKVEIPYIDIANEVMESFVQYLEDANTSQSVVAYNCTDGTSTAALLESPLNVNWGLYDQYIGRLASPSHTFPFNITTEIVREFLKPLDLSRVSLVSTMQSPHRDARRTTDEHAQFLQRTTAAEVLGLSHGDFVAITQESFWPRSQDQAEEAYRAQIGLQSTEEYWGYAPHAARPLGQSLHEITNNLLPRCGVSFMQLVTLLQGQWLADFRIVPASGAQDLSKAENLRLVDVQGNIASPELFDKLGSFVRLSHRSKWAVGDLDNALVLLAKQERITAETIVQLASIHQLGEATKKPIKDLLLLWSGPNVAVLHRQLQERGVHLPDLTALLTSHHRQSLLKVLALSATEWDTMATWADRAGQITLTDLGHFYPRVLLCQLLGVPLAQHHPLLRLLSGHPEPEKSWEALLGDPLRTLQITQVWKGLTARGWMVEELLLFGHHPSTSLWPESYTTDSRATEKLLTLAVDMVYSDPTTAKLIPSASLIERLKPDFPSTEARILEILLSALTPEINGLETSIAAHAKQQTGPFQGYFSAPESGAYEFRILGAGEARILNADNVPLKVTRTDNPTGSFLRTVLEVEKGRHYFMSVSAIEDVQVQRAGSSTCMPLHGQSRLMPQSVYDQVAELHHAITCGQTLVARSGLTPDDAAHLEASPDLQFTFRDLSLRTIQRAMRVGRLQSESPGAAIRLTRWASLNPDGQEEHFVVLVAKALGLPTARARALLNENYRGQALPVRIAYFARPDLQELERLSIQGRWLAQAGLSAVDPAILFQVAEASSMEPATAESILATLAQSRSTAAKASLDALHNTLRERRRNVLVEYLLQQEYIQKCHIHDANALFEYFLIDVQMGSTMRTSRMAQAIATVQLFAQRCLLSMEVGIRPTAINADRWAWMSQYRLWEANRKVFLYPENWVDPTLRDNKTEAFQECERQMMQTELREDSVMQLVRNYIYQADETAHLVIEAYHWDRKKATSSDYVVHLFGRTRDSPFVYYYRRLEALVTSGEVFPTWTPWEKIPFDIPTHTTDEKGNSLAEAGTYLVPVTVNQQLHLFTAHITCKARAARNQSTDSKPGSEAENYWEIKLGLSVCRRGQWSPVSISQANLEVARLPAIDGNRFPSIAAFRFWVDKVRTSLNIRRHDDPTRSTTVTKTRLTIRVDRWAVQGEQLVAVTVGSFELKGQEIVLGAPVANPASSVATFRTVFGKLAPPEGEASAVAAAHWQDNWGTEREKESLALAEISTPIPDDERRKVKWTTSYETHQYSSGFVAHVEQHNSDSSQTWIALPASKQPGSKCLASPAPAIRFDHILSPELVTGASVLDTIDEVYGYLRDPRVVRPEIQDEVFGGFNGARHKESATPFAIYNWELGLHLVSLLMERLLAVQQFDLALRVARQVFDPRQTRDVNPDLCWQFGPFQQAGVREAGSLPSIFRTAQASSGDEAEMAVSVLEWRRNPFNAHSVARNRPLVYMKRVAMKYVEILIAAGDRYFRQRTGESLTLAIQRYVEAAHVFGPAPVKMPTMTKPDTRSYRDLAGALNDFSNARVDMELLHPFYLPPPVRETASPATASQTLLAMMQTPYFCLGINPEIVRLRTTIDDRLWKLRSCLDIDGQAYTPSPFGSAVDPGRLVSQMMAGGGRSATSFQPPSPDPSMPNYRFQHLLQKAIDLCQELKSSGATYLSVKERRDGEALAVLNYTHESKLHALILSVKTAQLDEARRALEQLEDSRAGPRHRLEHYAKLAGDTVDPPKAGEHFHLIEQIHAEQSDHADSGGGLQGAKLMNKLEDYERLYAEVSADRNFAATVLDTVASGLALVPTVSTQVAPWGIGMTASLPPWGQGCTLAANVLRTIGQAAAQKSYDASRMNRLVQQLQDRRLQANLAGLELQSIDKQVAVHQARIKSIEADIDAQKSQITNTDELRKHLLTKTTNQELYGWLDNTLRSHFYETYQLASGLAHQAQRALGFELGRRDLNLIPSAWDSAHDGLLAGELLYQGLKQLDKAHMDHRPSDLEMVKTVSLRQLNPYALLQIREDGQAAFSLPEELFDLDYPGHFNRRIKSVAVSIPCVLGPHRSLNCTLTLKRHRYRVDKTVGGAGDYRYTGEDDLRFHSDDIPVTAIAVSHGQSDPGVAALDFRDERYMPMEGAGVISDWHLALPQHYRQFDYRTISDVIVHLRYTAQDGGKPLAQAATLRVGEYLQTTADLSQAAGLFTFLDVPNDCSNAWYSWKNARTDRTLAPTASPTPPTPTRSLQLANLGDMVPFYARCNRESTVSEVYLFLAGDKAATASLDAVAIHFAGTPLAVHPSIRLNGLTCFHGAGLAVPLHSSPQVQFQIATAPEPQENPQISPEREEARKTAQQQINREKLQAFITGVEHVFVLFRYQLNTKP